MICLASSVYQVASDPNDITNIAPVVLTSTSALASIFYTIVHTVFSFKQREWSLNQSRVSTIKETTYVAVRMVVALCALWLLTTGWNMIIVARRPICEQSGPPGLQTWEYGPRCHVSRVGIAFAVIALVASFILFGVLATVRRPFEAHIFKHGFQRFHHSFPDSHKSSPMRRTSIASEKIPLGSGPSVSTFRTFEYNLSDACVDTIDWNYRLPDSTIHTPSPVRSLGLGIFTSDSLPPPIPSAYATQSPLQPVGTFSHLPYSLASQHSLTRPPRLSGRSRSSSIASSIVPAEFSASTIRAVHPPQSSIGLVSRSHQHLPGVGSAHRKQYARSTISLTRPRRLSSVTPAGSVGWSSRSGSIGSDRLYSLSSTEGGAVCNKSVPEIANTAQHSAGRTESSTTSLGKTVRSCSAPASDAPGGADHPSQPSRMAMGWKPQLADQTNLRAQSKAEFESNKPFRLRRSTSAGFLRNFSPDVSPLDEEISFSDVYGRALDAASPADETSPTQRSWSDGAMRRHADATTGAVDPAQAAAVMLSKMPEDIRLRGSTSSGALIVKKSRFDDVKNKPLPRIAYL